MFAPTVASLLLLSASATVKATPCVAFDINWNLLAFGLDGKDWLAGTQDTWSGSKHVPSTRIILSLSDLVFAGGQATDITTTGRP